MSSNKGGVVSWDAARQVSLGIEAMYDNSGGGGAALAVIVLALALGVWAEFAGWVRSRLSRGTKAKILLIILAVLGVWIAIGKSNEGQPYIPKGRAAESFLPVPSSGTVADMAGELKKLGWTFVKAGPVAHKDFVYGAAGADIMDYENGKVTKVGTVLLLSKGESTPLAIRYDTNQVLFYDKTPGSRAIKLFSIIVNPSENKDQTGSIAWFRNLPVTGSLPATFDKPAAPVRKSPARFAKTAHNAG